MGNVDEAAGEVPGVRCTKRGIGEPFTGAVRTGEVIEDGQAFAIIRFDRQLDRTAGRIGDQPAHPGELAHLAVVAAGAGLGHHGERIEAFHTFFHRFADFIGRAAPDVDDFLVAFRFRDEAAAEEGLHLFDFGVFFGDDGILAFRHGDVIDADRNTGNQGVMETERFDAVQKFARRFESEFPETGIDELAHLFLINHDAQAFAAVASLVEGAEHFGDGVIEDDAARRRDDETVSRNVHPNERMQIFEAFVFVFGRRVGEHDFIVARKERQMIVIDGVLVFSCNREVIAPQNHILRRNGDRFAVFRRENVIDGEHQGARFFLRFFGKRQVAGHLVAVEVGIVARADERMQLDGAAFPKNRLKGLNAETMERRRTVQKHGMVFNDISQDVPDFRREFIDFFARDFEIIRQAAVDEFVHDERLEKLDGHFFRQPALVHFEFRTDDDNGTAGIVDTFPQKVLTETSLLTLEHIGKGFQGTVSGARHGTSATTVVNQRIDGFLEHTLFIPDDDFRRAELQKTFQTIVSIDDATIEIIQIARRKAAAVQLHHRAQIRRNDGDDRQNHPFGAIAGMNEGFDFFQTANAARATLSAARIEIFFELGFELFEIDFLQKRLNRFGAHGRFERIFAVIFNRFPIFGFRQNLLFREIRAARIEDDVGGKVEDTLQRARGNIQNEPDAAGDAFEIPNMRDRARQIDMTHPLAAHFGARDFHAALVADRAFVAHSFIFSAFAFPVLGRSENFLTEKPVGFRFQRPVIDGFRLCDLTVGPSPYRVRGGDADLHGVKLIYI